LNALLGPSKRCKTVVCRDSTTSDTPMDSDTDLAVPFAEDSSEEEEQDTDCVLCTDLNVAGWIRCAKYLIRAHTICVGMEEGFLCEPCQG